MVASASAARPLRPDQATAAGVLAVRLVAAVIQAAAVIALAVAAASPMHWPAKVPMLYLPLALVAAGVPLLVMVGAGRLPRKPLVAWALGAAALLAALGAHDVARAAPVATWGQDAWLPWGPLIPALLGGFFVANVLVTDWVVERRWLPPYARHVDTAWKHGLQALFAALFVGLFWGVLGLGAALFGMLGISLFGRIIQQTTFDIPATTLAVAVSIHVTDVQPGLIRGARTMVLALLSWLLPLLAAVLLSFLVALPFTTLSPLWQTHFAAALLMGASACLIFLINAAYGDGVAWAASRVKRVAAAVASLELLPLLGLAAWAVRLRVGQYGWTVDRVLAAAILLVMAWHAVGYTVASVARRARWHEATNFLGAGFTLLTILLLFSPVADPARLMVVSQVGRLRAGTVSPAGFDFQALRTDGAWWGAAALAQLKLDPEPAIATAARADWPPATAPVDDGSVLRPDELAGRVTVMPPDRSFPSSLLNADFNAYGGYPPRCFQAGTAVCTIRFVTLVENAPEMVILLDGETAALFEQTAPDQWRQAGTLSGAVSCASAQTGLASGNFTLIPHAARDILVNGMSLSVAAPPRPCPGRR